MGQVEGAARVSNGNAILVQQALSEVLESAPFRSTHQCQALLAYIVEHSLAGEGNLLRERVVGAQALGRRPDYDTGEDPIVRVRVAEVRKRLAQYYQSRTDSPVRIDIPSGSYRAVFQWKAAEVPPAAVEKRRRARRWLWIALALLVTAASAVVVVRGVRGPAPSALEQFWAPALSSPKPILIYNATTTVFRPAELGEAVHDLVQVRGQYTCIGDAYASLVLGSLFSRRGKLYQMRYGADLTFGDLRYQPSILIGAFNNEWTLQTTSDLRFVFEKRSTIRDRSNNRLYTLPSLQPDGRTPEDYAIVSRVFNSKTGELLIAAAGITQYGTHAAGEFLTSPNSMAALAAAAGAPRDWPKKNLQALLHTNIVGDAPGPPTIVETCFW
jgi:hypothetical protein